MFGNGKVTLCHCHCLQLHSNSIKMTDSNYFSWQNYGEMANIDSHINYATSLLKKYNWNAGSKKNIETKLNSIVKKQNDKLLNISVIGEFSTGKSSFINALVGQELLAVNVIQGTTVAITIIEYADNYSITLADFDGSLTKKEYTGIGTLRKYLHLYTTSPEYGKKISYLTVTLPSPILKRGFRIIDTPGTNSLELWHEEVTKKAITELSDLSIVMVDATQPMPESLMTFVDNTLETTIKDSVFVVNKIDLIKKRERAGIVKFTRAKASQRFDMESPVVFPFSSVALTNTFSKDKVAVDDNSVMLSTRSLDDLLSYTARQRIKAQARKVLMLIDGMYTTLDKDIKQIAEKYERQLKKLELSKQADLKPFITSQISKRQKKFLDEAKGHKYDVETTGDTLISKAIDNINSKISDCVNLDRLSEYIKGDLSSDIKKEGKSISKGMESRFSKVTSLFKKEISVFQKEFEREFERLNLLSIKLNVSPRRVSVRHSSNTANIGPVTTLISEELSKENWAIGGGMGVGAAIGTVILPGIGTVLGGIVGGIIGENIAPDTSEVKGKVKSKLSVPLKSYYKSIANDCVSNYNIYVNDVSKNIESEINKYYATYKSTVEEEIKQWNTKYSGVKNKIQEVREEMASIKSRQSSIKGMIINI